MRKLLFLFFATPFLMLSSCDDEALPLEPVGNVEINVKANYDGDLFQTQKEYEYIPGMKIKFTEFNFFVSNISLLEDENSTDETELADIDFVELSFDVTQNEEAEAGYDISTKKVPAGTYRAFKIGFGVPGDLNRTSPGDYGDGDVMATSTHFWAPLNSYIFSKIEGFSDNNGNGIFEGSEGENIRFHLGLDPIYTERILFPSEPIVVVDGESVKLTLNIDVKKLFAMPLNQFDANADNLLDVETYSESHGNPESEGFLVDKQLMRNFSEATSLDQ